MFSYSKIKKDDNNKKSKVWNKIYYYFEDNILSPGQMKNCPNCDKRVILSYPTTTCSFCKNVFSNNVSPRINSVDITTIPPAYRNPSSSTAAMFLVFSQL